ALEKMVTWNPATRPTEQLDRAALLESQFGVQTMAGFPIPLWRDDADKKNAQPDTWALDTLTDNETIARLATGVKRFPLPDDQNFIKLYHAVLEDPSTKGATDAARTAINRLAHIFEDRRQYDRAAEYWRMAIERFPGDERQQY